MRGRNLAFLLLTWEIEIFFIEENQLIFFIFCKENVSHQTVEQSTVGCTKHQNNFSLYRGILSSHKCTLSLLEHTSIQRSRRRIILRPFLMVNIYVKLPKQVSSESTGAACLDHLLLHTYPRRAQVVEEGPINLLH